MRRRVVRAGKQPFEGNGKLANPKLTLLWGDGTP